MEPLRRSGSEPPGPTQASPPEAVRRRVIRARGADYVSLGRSAAAHLRLILAIAVAGFVLGLAFGVVRPPTYKAEARLIVGKSISITNVAATAGLPAAAAQFASDYARLAGTEAVSSDAATRLGHRGTLGGSLSASPIPDSPIIRVDASASSTAAATALANAGAQAIIDQVDAINQSNSANLNDLTSSYGQIEFKLFEDTQQVNTLQAEVNAGGPRASSLETQLNLAKAAVATDTLESQAVQAQYDNQYSPVQEDAQVVSLASKAANQGSDRKSYLEIGVVGGALGGLIVGIAVAALIDLRRRSEVPSISKLRLHRN